MGGRGCRELTLLPGRATRETHFLVMGLNCHKRHQCSRQRSPGQLSFGKHMEACGTSDQGRSWGVQAHQSPGVQRGYTFIDSASPGGGAGLSGDRGVTDLLLAGAHRWLLLSRPPPRRTVRTLLEKQNWGVRHGAGGGYPASPTPALR